MQCAYIYIYIHTHTHNVKLLQDIVIVSPKPYRGTASCLHSRQLFTKWLYLFGNQANSFIDWASICVATSLWKLPRSVIACFKWNLHTLATVSAANFISTILTVIPWACCWTYHCITTLSKLVFRWLTWVTFCRMASALYIKRYLDVSDDVTLLS